jgi:PPOX class probable F420-dependent enzyme
MTTIPDSHKDLLDAPVAELATIGADGYPQVTSTWFIADGGEIKLSLNASRVKTKNLAKNSKVSLLIPDPQNPYRYVAIRGDAVISEDPDEALATKVNAKYDATVQDNDKPGEKRVAVTLTPVGVFAWPAG